MKSHYAVTVEVTVHSDDHPVLRAYALSRAIEAGLSEAEFDAYGADVADWLGWAFDAGTLGSAGFQIESSNVEHHTD